MGAGAGHGEVKWRIKEGRPARVQGHRRPSRSGDAQKTMVHLLGTGRHIVPPAPRSAPSPPHRDHPDCPTSRLKPNCRKSGGEIYLSRLYHYFCCSYIYIYIFKLANHCRCESLAPGTLLVSLLGKDPTDRALFTILYESL